MGFADFGADAMKDDGVVNTGFGLLRQLSKPFRQLLAVSMRME